MNVAKYGIKMLAPLVKFSDPTPVYAQHPPKVDTKGVAPPQDGFGGATQHSGAIIDKFLRQRLRDQLGQSGISARPLTPYDLADHGSAANDLLALTHRLMSNAHPASRPQVTKALQQSVERSVAEARAAFPSSHFADRTINDMQSALKNGLDVWSAQGTAFHQSSSMVVEMVTREGDIVAIDMSRVLSAGSGQASVPGGNAEIVHFASDTTLRYSVRGDLNDAERSAIESLLGKLNDYANSALTDQKAFQDVIDFVKGSDSIGTLKADMQWEQSVAVVVQRTDTGAGAMDSLLSEVRDQFSQLFAGEQDMRALLAEMVGLKTGAKKHSM